MKRNALKIALLVGTGLALLTGTAQAAVVVNGDLETAVPEFSNTNGIDGYGLDAAGTKVDVYLLHLDPPSSVQANDVVGYQANCTIRFDQPILGVIVAGATFETTDVPLGFPGARYPINDTEINDIGPRGIDIQTPTPDAIKIVEGGRAIRVDLKIGPQATGLDQLRVVVLSKENQP
ncbi:MAG: hypothetical protein AAGB26_17075 [Planctomycetota bacterium]